MNTVSMNDSRIRKSLNDPSFNIAQVIPISADSDDNLLNRKGYILTFSSRSLDPSISVLGSARLNFRIFASIDSANKIAIDLGYDEVFVNNKMELFN